MKNHNFQFSTVNFQLKVIAAGFFLFVAWQVTAQSAQDDLLQGIAQKALSQEVSDFARRTHFLDLISRYSNIKDRENTFLWYRRAVDFAREKKNLEFEADFMGSIGWAYGVWNQSDSSLLYYDNALKLIEGKGYSRSESELYRSKGTLYGRLFFYETAIEYQLKALEMNEKEMEIHKDDKDVYDQTVGNKLTILNSIGSIYSNQLNYTKSLEFFLRAKKVIDDHPAIAFGRFESFLYANIAFGYLNKNDPDQAFPYIEKAYQMAIDAKAPQAIFAALFRYSRYYIICEEYPTALRYAKEAAQVAEGIGFAELINRIELEIMEISYYLKDYTSAFAYGERLLQRIPEENLRDLRQVYSVLTRLYALTGDQKSANKYWEKENEMVGKMTDRDMQNALQEKEVKYDVQQKELEITRKQVTIDRQQKRQFIFIGGLIATGLLLSLSTALVVQHRRRNRILVETNAFKDKFFSIISHDLKNPAISQRAALQTLLDNVGQWDTQALRQYYKGLLTAADHQVDLLYNLLNWAHVHTGRMPYSPSTFDLSTSLKTDLALLQYMADVKNIRLNIQLPQHALVTGDSDMLVTVVRNIVTNALKFTPDGGYVTLAVTPSIDEARSLNEAEGRGSTTESTKYTVSITDTGTGMSAEQMQNLFCNDRASSLTGVVGRQRRGLGLVISREFLEKHGSHLHVESQEGAGSRFWFEV